MVTPGAGFISFAVPVKGQPDKFLLGYNHNNDKRILLVTWNTHTNNPDPGVEILNRADEPIEEDTINYGTVGPHGVLWFWTMNMHGQLRGSVYSFNPFLSHPKTRKHVIEGNYVSNGLVWCPLDQSRLYYVDALRNRILLYHYDIRHSNISGLADVIFELALWARYHGHDINTKHAHLSHMAIDVRGVLWVPVFGRSEVLEFFPYTKTVGRVIHIPAAKVSSCAFGGTYGDILYVSTYGYGYNNSRDVRPNGDNGGAIFAVSNLGVIGYEAKPFLFPRPLAH
ncbi:putative sugar lactone lactonase YvrE [Belonocnema kinseyi]|uniref:putative sugar lactone lactonase YvrE n=1 Tax=Belonocnema kinseyi TaxID=2817044 RepID=UPI00143D2AF3|nr:putative sugar lactone lactonase YvrE [Belonocnema kinseyi]